MSRIAIPRPSDFGTVGGWWPPDDPTATLISGKYSVAPDRSGNGRDLLQGTSGKRPTKVAGAWNGRAARRYVAASSTHMLSATFGVVAHPLVYWIVAKLTSQGGLATLFNTAVAGPGIADAIYAPDGTHTNLYGEGTALSGGPVVFNMTSAFATYVGICNGASSSLRINGTQVATGTVTSTSGIVSFAEGAIFDGTSQFIDGDVLDCGFFVGLPSSISDFENFYLRREFRTW